MRTITTEELKKILEEHRKWLENPMTGKRADLHNANLCGANLYGANLRDANVSIPLACSEKGGFTGWKVALVDDSEIQCIVKLYIPADAKRSSATSRKCRANKAKVISITSIDGETSYETAYSYYDNDFIYRVGEYVEVKNFDENRFNECAPGIHFFITCQEAVDYAET